MVPIPRLKEYKGPAILSYGFRPFFLLGAVYAGVGIAIWLPLYFGQIEIPTALSLVDWHIHEMLFGYLPAVVTGFLLTAIPNWTGRLPLQGCNLGILVMVWLAGRVAIFSSGVIGPTAAGVVDCLFLLLVAAAATREVIVGRNWRNLPPVGVLLLFFVGNVVFHLEDISKGSADAGMRLGIAAVVVLIALIGGRVIPSFTRNWLARENPGRFPVPFNRFDIAVLLVSALALAVWIISPDGKVTAVLMLASGLAQLVRLSRWAGYRTWRDRLVLVLHVGYMFIPFGYLLLSGAILLPDTIPISGAIHAWTVGAAGVMTLAIMTRASLGHTGQPLSANWLTQSIYALVVLAALLRIAASFFPDRAATLIIVAGGLWVAAFWGFAIGYGPFLCRPRVNTH